MAGLQTREAQNFPAEVLAALVFLLLVLTGCDKSVKIGPEYELIKLPGLHDGHAGSSLLYHGTNIWPLLYAGSVKSFHEGIFVFQAPVPNTSGDYDSAVSPQLFAIRGEGPPLLISEKIYGQPMEPERSFKVRNFEPEEGGMTVEFDCTQGSTNRVQLKRVVIWPEIELWLQEARGASVAKVTPLAIYRLLPFNSTNEGTSTKAAQSLESLKGIQGPRP